MVAGVSESIKNINWVSDEAREVKKKTEQICKYYTNCRARSVWVCDNRWVICMQNEL